MRFSTKAIHVGQKPDPATGATIPPIHLTSTYTQELPGRHKGFEYSRSNNPTRSALEQCLASLEEGEACAAFSSGIAAAAAVLQTLRPGDGVVGGHDLYGGTVRLLTQHFVPWGLEVAFAASTEPDAYAEAANSLSRPRLLWLETPSNPLLEIVDIRALAALGQSRDMRVLVDNTFASPYLQKPLVLGADLVLHSTTKYLGGHSDVIGGAIVARSVDRLDPIRFVQNAAGAVPGPLDCYLVQRGLKTLALRMERHCRNARHVAKMLSNHPKVKRVLYPGFQNHPGHRVAAEQMSGMGGMVTFELADGPETVDGFFSHLQLFSTAESLGGVESLASHPASMTHSSLTPERRKAAGITDTMIRLSVGIEDVEDLLRDLERALR